MIEKRFNITIDYEKETIHINDHIRDGYWDTWRLAYTQYLDTREQRIREALISLGWTPPPEK